MSGDLASHRYVRGRGHGGNHEKDFPHRDRRMDGVDHPHAGGLSSVLPRDAGGLLRAGGHVHGPCRGLFHDHRGLDAPGRGEDSGRAPLCLSCHGPCLCLCSCPHDRLVRGHDGLDESGDVPSHRDGGENGL